MPNAVSKHGERWHVWLCTGFIALLSFFTYVYNFSTPQAFFWDENYHIASAQKYLSGVFFMEQHPPLGKLMVALGEKVLDLNERDDSFITTDYARNPPEGFSFTGYRLFPVLLAWLTAPLLFWCFFLLTRHLLSSTIFSFLYVFDNAFIVHMRGAMLESTLLFFMTATILAFLLLREWKDVPRKFPWASLLFGAAFGCVMTTKLVGLILILLVPAIAWLLRRRWEQFAKFGLLALAGFLVTYVGVWHTHFALGSRVIPQLPDDGYYQASPAYVNILESGRNASPLAFPVMLRDSLKFVSHYNAGVPVLDLCKEDENGSPFFFWPFGARAINYRWETPNGQEYRYLYLQSNPVAWGLGLAGVLLAFTLLLSGLVSPPKQGLRNKAMLVTFFALYVCYMLAMSQIDRVMYLYHYFPPLLFSFFLFALAFTEIRQFGGWALTENRRNATLITLAVLVFAGFQFYRPLSYYEPLNDDQFRARAIFPLWDLQCVNCEENRYMLQRRR